MSTTHRTRTTTHRTRAVAVAALTAGLLISTAGVPTQAGDDSGFYAAQSNRVWNATVLALPIAPYMALSDENEGQGNEYSEAQAGLPFTRAYLDSTPGRSECFAAFGYPGLVAEEGVFETTGHYKNPSLARSSNPDTGRGSKAEVAPFGASGPFSRTDNPDRTHCIGEVRYGGGGNGGTVDIGYARVTTAFNLDDLLVDESTVHMQGIDLGGQIRIATFDNSLKLEYPLVGEPKVSYKLSFAGVSVGGQELVGFADKAFTLSGQGIPIGQYVTQFNTQAAQWGQTFEGQGGSGFLRLAAPEVTRRVEGLTVTAASVEGRLDPAARDKNIGDHMGFRLGYTETYGYLVDTTLVGAPPVSSDQGGGTAPPTTPGLPTAAPAVTGPGADVTSAPAVTAVAPQPAATRPAATQVPEAVTLDARPAGFRTDGGRTSAALPLVGALSVALAGVASLRLRRKDQA